MSKPRGDPSCGTSSDDALIRTERHPAYRRREPRPGFRTERENLAGDAKGKGASGYNREVESTDAPERGGLPRISDEAGECPGSEGGSSSPLDRVNKQGEDPNHQWKAAAFMRWHEPYESRGSRTESVRGSGGNSSGLLGKTGKAQIEHMISA